jgi:hypothetical protein
VEQTKNSVTTVLQLQTREMVLDPTWFWKQKIILPIWTINWMTKLLCFWLQYLILITQQAGRINGCHVQPKPDIQSNRSAVVCSADWNFILPRKLGFKTNNDAGILFMCHFFQLKMHNRKANR